MSIWIIVLVATAMSCIVWYHRLYRMRQRQKKEIQAYREKLKALEEKLAQIRRDNEEFQKWVDSKDITDKTDSKILSRLSELPYLCIRDHPWKE